VARENKATGGGAFWQAELQGTFEETTSYTLIPTKREPSILQDGGALENTSAERSGTKGEI
jgi:hypothetical protein